MRLCLLVLVGCALAIDAFAAPGKPSRQRRTRYSGKYPKRFEEKHKERAGDEATVARVLLKGGTPAGSHVPIMAAECLAHLGLTDGETDIIAATPSLSDEGGLVVVDCTLGFGGHSRLILDALGEQVARGRAQRGELVAFDQDSIELAKTETRLREHTGAEERGGVHLECVHANFATISSTFVHRPAAHALLADLGCSSMQIDDPTRGFTWKADGALDMRMNAASSPSASSTALASPGEGAGHTAPLTAAELLVRSNVSSLAAILRSNSDFEREDSHALAAAILAAPLPLMTFDLGARVRSVRPPVAPASPNRGDLGGGRGTGGQGGRGGSGRGGGKGSGRGGGKGEVARERDGGFKALEHAKRLRAMGTKKLLREIDEGERDGDIVVAPRRGGGKAKHTAAEDAERERELNSRVARVMQALRIEVNGELEALDALLAALPSVLAPNGRAVFLTFHSGEDRRVKQAMKDGLKSGAYCEISRRVGRVSREEARANPRSKCCKLRWCVRAAT